MNVADRLAAAGFELPPAPSALGAYVPARLAGGVVYTSGQLPLVSGSLITSGIVGAEVDGELAARCAAQAALNALAAASTVCDLDAVRSVVRLVGYVAAASDFTAHPAVVNGASEVLLAAYGPEAGCHARSAVGVASLPLGSPVEVELVLMLEEARTG